MDLATQKKWDKAAPTFDLMAGKGAEERWEPFKRELFLGYGRTNFVPGARYWPRHTFLSSW